MTQQEQYEVALAWDDLVIADRPAKLDQLFADIDQRLPSDWIRNRTAESNAKTRGASLPGSRCYSSSRAGQEVALWLLRVTDRRIQGGLVESSDPARYLPSVAEGIVDFRHRVLEPAAEAFHLTISRNQLGPHSLVPAEVKDSLWSLYESSDFQWPPAGGLPRKWRQFVANVYRTGAAFDTHELSRWLVEKGWKKELADAMIEQLLTDAAMLAELDDLRQPA